MVGNKSLNKAKGAKQDEFYTRRDDIENELCHYEGFFENKVVYMNCDDPKESEFWQFFVRNFRPWKIKKLIATHYEPNEKNYAYKLELTEDTNGDGLIDWNDEPVVTQLPCNGDFRSAACIELLKEADVVVTNPPFSLFREYIAQLIKYDKKFLVIGNMNAITYKEVFPLLKQNKIWVGTKSFSGGMNMIYPKHLFDKAKVKKYCLNEDGNYIVNVMGVIWFTNLDHKKRHELLDLRGTYYSPENYPKYDNYNAINVDKVADIPCDYNGVMGVPITFMDKYNPEQFEILGYTAKDMGVECLKFYENLEQSKNGEPFIKNSKSARFSPMIIIPQRPKKTCYKASNANGYMLKTYGRIFIQRKDAIHED